ncbi:hypothetical protein YC2023_076328 [Brassica napus]
MSMLDSFFNKTFKAVKCKTLLKLLIPRIKLIRNRREAKIKQMRREIAKLLETGQEATTRIRVEHIIREEKMMAAQEILELFCELIAEFVAAAFELKPDSGVNRKEIAQEHQLDWDPASTETDLFKSREDLIVSISPLFSAYIYLVCFGSYKVLYSYLHQAKYVALNTEMDQSNLVGGSKLPLREEQDKGPRLTMLPLSRPEEPSDSESEYESLEFPEILNVLLRPTPGATPENAPEAVKPATYEHTSPDMPFDSENAGDEKLSFIRDEHPAISSTTVVEVQQSSPFVFSQYVTESEKRDSCSPPSACVVGPLFTEKSGASRDLPRKISDMDLQDVLTAAQAAADSADRIRIRIRPRPNGH